MSVQKLNIQVDQGTDFSETIIAKTSTGSIIDLSGYTVAGQIRKTYDSSTATPFTAGFGVRTSGEVTIELARSVTSSLEAGRYVYDVEITSGADKRTRLVQGQVTVTQEVTRAGAIDYIDEVNITNPVDGSLLVYDNATSKWIDDATIKRVDTDNVLITADVDVAGTVEADGFSGTGALTITDFIDDDSFGTATATNVPTSQSVKAYVDATSSISSLNDTSIASPVAGQFLIYDGTDTWDNKSITGDVTFTAGGVSSISSDSIINADIKSDAAISISKTALIAGTGIDLDTNTISLSDGAALSNLTGGSSTTTFLRNDGAWSTPVDTTYTSGTGLTLGGTEFSLSTGASLTNLGGDGTDYSGWDPETTDKPLFHTFLRKDGGWHSVKQYSGGTGINVIASSNVALNDTITLDINAALTNLGGASGDDQSLLLAKNGSWVAPSDDNTEYTAGTGLDLNTTVFSLSTGAAFANLGGAAGEDQELVLNKAGFWTRPPTYILANTGLTFVANTTAETADHASFAVNASLTHLTTVGSSATSTDFFGDTITLGGTATSAASTLINGAAPYLNFYNTKNIASGLSTSSTEFTGVIPFYGIAIDTDNSDAQSYKPSARIFTKFTDCTESALAGQMVFEVTKAGATDWSMADPNPKNVMVLEPGTVTIGVAGTENALDLTDLAVNGDASVSGDLVVTGDLTVNGTETVINSTTLSVDDKNIVLGSVDTPTDTTADGGGITLKGTTDKTLNWVDSTDSWTASENFELASGKAFRINANEVLNQTTLGSTVLASSLTSVGTIGTGVWNGTAIADTYISSADTWNAKQAALSFGIVDTNSIVVDGTPVDGEFAQFTSAGLVSRSDAQVLSDIGAQGALTFGKVSGNALKSEEALVTNDVLLMGTTNVKGRTYADFKSDLSLDNVENSAISTFAGSSNIVTTGALDAGSITSGFTSIDIGAGALTAGATTVNGELTVNSDTLKLTSTTASSTVEHPSLELYRNGGVGSGDLGAIKFFGNNDATTEGESTPEKFQYAGIYASVQTATDGAEQGSLAFSLGHGGLQEDPAMSLFSYGLQMGYGNPILMSYSNGYQQFFSPDAATKSFKLNATPNATVPAGSYEINLPDVEGGTLAVINSDKDFTAGAITGDSFQGSQLALIIGSGTVASINKATHSGRKIVYNGATASAWTLDDCPAADVGVTYTLVNAGTSTVTISRNTNSVFSRLVLGASPLTAASISISKGGIIEIVCTAENVYSCFGSGIQ